MLEGLLEPDAQECWSSSRSGSTHVTVARYESASSRNARQVFNHDTVRANSFLRECSEQFVSEVLAELNVELFAAGQELFREGDFADAAYFLCFGQVEVLVGPSFRKVSVLPAGSVIGEMALFDKSHKRSATVRALEFCDCRAINNTIFQKILQRFPKDNLRLKAWSRVRASELKQIRELSDDSGRRMSARSLWKYACQSARSMIRRGSLPTPFKTTSEETALEEADVPLSSMSSIIVQHVDDKELAHAEPFGSQSYIQNDIAKIREAETTQTTIPSEIDVESLTSTSSDEDFAGRAREFSQDSLAPTQDQIQKRPSEEVENVPASSNISFCADRPDHRGACHGTHIAGPTLSVSPEQVSPCPKPILDRGERKSYTLTYPGEEDKLKHTSEIPKRSSSSSCCPDRLKCSSANDDGHNASAKSSNSPRLERVSPLYTSQSSHDRRESKSSTLNLPSMQDNSHQNGDVSPSPCSLLSSWRVGAGGTNTTALPQLPPSVPVRRRSSKTNTNSSESSNHERRPTRRSSLTAVLPKPVEPLIRQKQRRHSDNADMRKLMKIIKSTPGVRTPTLRETGVLPLSPRVRERSGTVRSNDSRSSSKQSPIGCE